MSVRARLQFWSFRVLFPLALMLAGWLAQRHFLEFDWSFAQKNSLSEESAALLEHMSGGIEISAFARDEAVLRRRIENLVGRYQRAGENVELRFVDPDLHPDVVRGLGITRNGELLVRYGGGEQKVQTLTEVALSNVLLALSQRERRTIRFLVGHGERALTDDANHDMGEIGRRLQAAGITIEPLDLLADPRIPDDTSLLLIAGPRTPPAQGEIDLLDAYLAGGGNLLWLADPGLSGGWEDLADTLGIRFLAGTVVDTAPRMFGLKEPAFTLISDYPDHPVTAGLDGPTLFPLATALEVYPDSMWQAVPLLATLPRVWTETEHRNDPLSFDPEAGERRGPLTIGMELTRDLAEGPQRVVVVGDGDFLANAYLGNGSNVQLGMNLFNWLTSESRRLDIAPRATPDTQLQLSENQLVALGTLFLVVLPGFLVAGGTLSWWRRRNG